MLKLIKTYLDLDYYPDVEQAISEVLKAITPLDLTSYGDVSGCVSYTKDHLGLIITLKDTDGLRKLEILLNDPYVVILYTDTYLNTYILEEDIHTLTQQYKDLIPCIKAIKENP